MMGSKDVDYFRDYTDDSKDSDNKFVEVVGELPVPNMSPNVRTADEEESCETEVGDLVIVQSPPPFRKSRDNLIRSCFTSKDIGDGKQKHKWKHCDKFVSSLVWMFLFFYYCFWLMHVNCRLLPSNQERV